MQEAFDLLHTPYHWALYFFCAMLIGMSKTGVQNIGTLAVPLFAFLFGARYSTGIVLILLCMADLIAVIYYRKQFRWSEIKGMLPAAFVGLLGGLLLANNMDDQLFRILMGICILSGVGIMIWMEKSKSVSTVAEKSWYAPLFGFIAGFSTMIGNAAGPALSVYLLSRKLPKYAFVATGAWFIMILNYTKIPLQLFVWHNLSWAGIILNVFAIPFILLGGYLGIRIIKVIPEKQFRILVMALVAVSALLLIIL
ncbi:sulfite exporter TauE/SafE family protein [Sphingobacterium spiritivorum]